MSENLIVKLAKAVKGVELSSKGVVRRMAPQNLNAAVVFGQEPSVRVDVQALDSVPDHPILVPYGVNINKLPVK